MPICITFIKVMQMHWIILFFCNTQVGLIVTILSHLFHLCNTLWTHWQYNIQPNSHMHYPHQSNANALDYFVVMQNSCLGYISYLIKQCNTLWTHWQYHIQPNSHMHYLHQGDAIPLGQNTNIISNNIHIYIPSLR
jgi:hypothetical protein